MVSFIEVLTSLSIAFMLSTLGMRQSRFYHALMKRFMGRYALPEAPDRSSIIPEVLQPTTTGRMTMTHDTGAIQMKRRIALTFDPDARQEK